MAAADLICSCGGELHVSGATTYVSEEAAYFHRLHKGVGHEIVPDPEPGEKSGRDNGVAWWKANQHPRGDKE